MGAPPHHPCLQGGHGHDNSEADFYTCCTGPLHRPATVFNTMSSERSGNIWKPLQHPHAFPASCKASFSHNHRNPTARSTKPRVPVELVAFLHGEAWSLPSALSMKFPGSASPFLHCSTAAPPSFDAPLEFTPPPPNPGPPFPVLEVRFPCSSPDIAPCGVMLNRNSSTSTCHPSPVTCHVHIRMIPHAFPRRHPTSRL